MYPITYKNEVKATYTGCRFKIKMLNKNIICIAFHCRLICIFISQKIKYEQNKPQNHIWHVIKGALQRNFILIKHRLLTNKPSSVWEFNAKFTKLSLVSLVTIYG